MQPETKKLLLDIHNALEDIAAFTEGMDLDAYSADAKCRAAVERKFEVAGEACGRLRASFPDICEQLPDIHRMIGFRNRIIHGYDDVDDAIVWDVVTSKLRPLAQRVWALLHGS